MQNLNEFWNVYGSNTASDYKVLVMEVDGKPGGSDISAARSYKAQYGMTCPFIPALTGGIEFMYNGFSYGGSAYLIKPDYTWVDKQAYAGGNNLPAYFNGDLSSEGITPYKGYVDKTAPYVYVATAPAKGSTLTVGSTQTIKWHTADLGSVKYWAIKFSTDNGKTYTPADSADSSLAVYRKDDVFTCSWKVPNVNSNTCKIRVIAYDAAKNAGIKDTGTFTISGSSNIISQPEVINNLIEFRETQNAFMIYIPFDEKVTLSITDVQGRIVACFPATLGKRWYTVTRSLSSGMHIVSIKRGYQIITKKFWLIR